jgi:hypothetical protein
MIIIAYEPLVGFCWGYPRVGGAMESSQGRYCVITCVWHGKYAMCVDLLGLVQMLGVLLLGSNSAGPAYRC